MPRPKTASRLTSKLEAAKALEAEIKALKAKDKGRRKAETEARFRLAGREVIAMLETHPESEFSKAIKALLAAKLVKPGERALFPELPALKAPTQPSEPAQAEA